MENNKDLVSKIREAIMDMYHKVSFSEDGHTYKDLKTGTWLQGVTSVSSIVPKDWLAAWGAKEAVKFLGYSDYEGDVDRAIEVLSLAEEMSAKQWIEFLKEAKGSSGRKSKTALVDGKKGHAWLEEYVKARIRGKELPAMPVGTLKRPIEQFLEWEVKNISTWVLSEARVAYPEKGYAGTMDALAIMKNGKLAVVDFKFASHISEDYFLQTAAYAFTFEPYGIKIDDRIIIRLPKTLEREEWNDKEKKYEMMPNNLEEEIVKTNYEFDKNTFVNALPVKQWCNQFKKSYGK